jgi:hypothetical protein
MKTYKKSWPPRRKPESAGEAPRARTRLGLFAAPVGDAARNGAAVPGLSQMELRRIVAAAIG